jgi:uncharacterized linocin/CFP29 family protein
MDMDFILNGSATGSSASMLLATNGDLGILRPWIGRDGKTYASVRDGFDDNGNPKERAIVVNSGATLRKNEWQRIDEMVVKAARPRLKLINNMRSAGLTYSMANAFGTSVLQYERQSDISRARIGMDVTPAGDNDRPTYDIVNLPLPIISKEITMSARAIAISRNGNTPLDVSNLELAATKVAEEAEQLVLGSLSTYTYGGGSVYGLINFPQRITGSFLNPSVSGWTPTMLYNSVIDMFDQATQKFHYGPYDLYYSTGLLKYMMQQFSIYDSTSLEGAIRKLPGMASVGMLDYLTGNQLVLVERSSSVARIVMGMDITTVQWQENGGATEKFRVMAMMVPQLKTDQAGNTGIVHYSGNATTV